MINKAIVLACIFIFGMSFISFEKAFASPIDNVNQFQAKVVSSVLKNPRNTNFGTKKEYIEWVDLPASVQNKASGKDDRPPLINIGERPSSDTTR